MKIKFFLSDNEMAPTTISDNLFADSLINRGYNVEKVISYKRKKEIIEKEDADIIIFQKKILPGHKYQDIYKLKGKVFLCHIDDDFEGMNEEVYKKTLEISDLILVGNKAHAKNLSNYINTPVEVIVAISDFENYKFISINKKNNKNIVISWQQNLADVYVEDLRSISKPLNEIYKKYNIDLRLYGWHEGKHYGVQDKRGVVKEFLPFAKFISFQPIKLYLKNIVPEISMSDIGIIPYIDSINRCGKSGCSLKKMMMMGIPMIVSDLPNNIEIIENGINGFLASGDEDWYEKLELLINKNDLREEIAINARRKLEQKFSYENTVDIFINAIRRHFAI